MLKEEIYKENQGLYCFHYGKEANDYVVFMMNENQCLLFF